VKGKGFEVLSNKDSHRITSHSPLENSYSLLCHIKCWCTLVIHKLFSTLLALFSCWIR